LWKYEKNAAGVYVRAGAASYRDTGLCYIQAGLDPARLPEALKVIDGELLRLITEPVTTEELRDAKTSMKAGWHSAGKIAVPKRNGLPNNFVC